MAFIDPNYNPFGDDDEEAEEPVKSGDDKRVLSDTKSDASMKLPEIVFKDVREASRIVSQSILSISQNFSHFLRNNGK
jgi:hypothetical protein